jgi:Amt family ammonium transporter
MRLSKRLHGLTCNNRNLAASGYVGAPAAVAIGFVTAFFCNLSTRLKFVLRVDDALDVFATHGIGGIWGCILTGLFAQASVAGLDGTVIPGGWIDHHYIQLGYQVGHPGYRSGQVRL